MSPRHAHALDMRPSPRRHLGTPRRSEPSTTPPATARLLTTPIGRPTRRPSPWRPRWPRWLILALIAAATLWPSTINAQPRPRRAEVHLHKSRSARLHQIRAHLAHARRFVRLRPDLALQHVDEAVALDEDRAETHRDAGLLLHRHRDRFPDRWRLHLTRYTLLEPNPQAQGLAEVHTLLGRDTLTRALQSDAVDASAAFLLDLAETHLLTAHDLLYETQSLRDLAEAERLLARVHLVRKRYDAGLRAIRACYDHGGGGFEALQTEVRLLLATHQGEQALQRLKDDQTLRRLDDLDRISLELLRARVYQNLGETQTALQTLDNVAGPLQEILNADPTTPHLRELLEHIHSIRAGFFADSGDYLQALVHQRQAHDLSPERPHTMNNLAWSIAMRSRTHAPELEEALRLSRRAVELEPNAVYFDTLAEVYLRLGRPLDAQRAIDNALLLMPDSDYLQRQRRRILTARTGYLGTSSLRRLLPWTPPRDDAP